MELNTKDRIIVDLNERHLIKEEQIENMNQKLANSDESKEGLKNLNNKLIDQLKNEKLKIQELNMKLSTVDDDIKERKP